MGTSVPGVAPPFTPGPACTWGPHPSPRPPPRGDPALCRLYLPILQPKITSTLHTCIQEVKCYFSENGK
uniref:Uncharacterized protein n=1 Tax=Oryctolagus cuniculus TaxID=9986 RepID=A0A5F9CWK0_RABIT